MLKASMACVRLSGPDGMTRGSSGALLLIVANRACSWGIVRAKAVVLW